MDSNASRAHRQQALAAYVEPLAVGKRVAVFGDASLSLGPRIAELGARSVQLWDPDPERARREAELAPRGILVRPLPGGSPGSGETSEPRGVFDLVVIPDLEVFDDAVDLLARVRGLVGDDGSVLVCAANREGEEDSGAFDYYELFDLVASEFRDVTMIAQLPFQGVALAELLEEGEEDSPAVTVDTQLAGSNRAPEAYLALGSQRGVRLDPYAIVELPPGIAPDEESEDVETARISLAQAAIRVVGLEEEVEDLRSRIPELERGVRAAVGLEDALRERSLRVAELEAAVAARSRDVLDLSREVQQLRATAEAERAGLAAQLEVVLIRADRAEHALAASEPEQVRAAERHAVELARYEEVLRDRAQAMRALEAELVRRERMVRELVDAIEEAGQAAIAPPPHPAYAPEKESTPEYVAHRATPTTPPPTPESNPELLPEYAALVEANAQLRQKLDALALDLARREGEAQASAWAIAELERRLETESAKAPPPPEARPPEPPASSDDDSEAKRLLAAALDELDVLRRALAQEHQARMQAESTREPVQERAQERAQD
jgi:hypothetical protein